MSSLVLTYQLHRGLKRLAPASRGGAPAAPGAVTAEQVALAMLGEESTPAELPGNPGAGGTEKRRKSNSSPMTGWLRTVLDRTRFYLVERVLTAAINVQWRYALSGSAKTSRRGLDVDLWTGEGEHGKVAFPPWFGSPDNPGALAEYRTWREVDVPRQTANLDAWGRREYVNAGAQARVQALLKPLVTVWLGSEGRMQCSICACCGLAGIVETDDPEQGFVGKLPDLGGPVGKGHCNLLFRKEELKKPWNVRLCLLCSAAKDAINKGTLDCVPDPSVLAVHPRLCLYAGYTGKSKALLEGDKLVRPRRWETLEHQSAFFEMSCSSVTTIALRQLMPVGMFTGDRGWMEPHERPGDVVWFWAHAFAMYESRAAPWGFTRFVISRIVDSEPEAPAPEGEPVAGSPTAAEASTVDPVVSSEHREEEHEEPEVRRVTASAADSVDAPEGLEGELSPGDGPSLVQPEGTPERPAPADPTEIPDSHRGSGGGGGLEAGGWPPLGSGAGPTGSGGSGAGRGSGSGKGGGDGRDDDDGDRRGRGALRSQSPDARARNRAHQRRYELILRLFGLLRFLYAISEEQEVSLMCMANPEHGDQLSIHDIVFNIPSYLADWGVSRDLLPSEQELADLVGANPSAGPDMHAMAAFLEEVRQGGYPLLQDPDWMQYGQAPPEAPAQQQVRPPPVPPLAALAQRPPPAAAGPAPAAPAALIPPGPPDPALHPPPLNVPGLPEEDIASLPEDDPGYGGCPPHLWVQAGFGFALAVIAPHQRDDESFYPTPPDGHVITDPTCPVSSGPVIPASGQFAPGVGFGAGGMPMPGSELRPLWVLPPSVCPEGHTPVPRPPWARHARPSDEWCWGCWSGIQRHWSTRLPVFRQRRLKTGGKVAGYGLCQECNRLCGNKADEAFRQGAVALWFLWRSLMDSRFRRSRDDGWLREAEATGKKGARDALVRQIEGDPEYALDPPDLGAGKGKDASPPLGGKGPASAKDKGKGKGQGKGKDRPSPHGDGGKGAPERMPSGMMVRPFFDERGGGGKGKDKGGGRDRSLPPPTITREHELTPRTVARREQNRILQEQGLNPRDWAPAPPQGEYASSRQEANRQREGGRERSRTADARAPRGPQAVRGVTPSAGPRPVAPPANPAPPAADADPRDPDRGGRARAPSQQPRQQGGQGPPGGRKGGPGRKGDGKGK